MNQDIREVLESVTSHGKHTGHNETVYQLGVLAAWVARLAKTDWAVRAELQARLTKVNPKR